jgi:hemoglobin
MFVLNLLRAVAGNRTALKNSFARLSRNCGGAAAISDIQLTGLHKGRAMTQGKIPTLYEWVGGIERIETLFMAFYQRVPEDTILAPVFAEMSPHHFKIVAHFVGEVLGGPKLYSGDGSHNHSTMVAKHLERHLTNQQRKRWMDLLLDTADQLNLPDDPEFRSALVGYLEWGSRLAVINSASSDNPISESAPMPKWGWGEPKGPYIPSTP